MAGNVDRPQPGQVTADTSRHVLRSGWTVLAAVLMIFGGAMAILEGIAAIAKDDLFVRTAGYTFRFTLTGWGWIHLVLGVAVVLAGCALFGGAVWARAVGVVLAGLSLIANFLWVPYYPFWAITLIAVNIFIIWALCAGSLRDAGRP